MKAILVIFLVVFTFMLGAKDSKSDCYSDLNICRAACYDKKDITGDCILGCYDMNSKCLKEKFK